MAREQQFNNSQRQVINTIEDTSKYQTGDSRRLRVTADPLRIYEAPKETGLAKLTEALGAIKPELLQWATDKQTEAKVKAAEMGKRAAQTGAPMPKGEMEQYGYDSVKAVNDWTDWNQQVLQEYDQTFDKQEGNLEEFLKKQWETNPFKDKSETYMQKFTPLAGKTMEKIRAAQGQFKADLQESLNNAELTRMFGHDINDVMGAGMEYNVSTYEARRDNLKAQFPGKTNSQLDELAYQAVLSKMEETGDTSLVNIFKQPHSDKTPGLYEIPKWKDKIDSDVRQILAAKNSARNKIEAENEKALKNAADVIGNQVLFAITDANSYADPTVRAEKLRAINETLRSQSEAGIPIQDSIIRAVSTALTGIDKKQETQYQADNYVRLRLGDASVSRIAQAYNVGDISQSAFDKLMSKKEAASNRADKEKPLPSNPFVKQALKEIEVNAGYSPYNMTKDGEEARSNANAVKARVLDLIEDLVDSGVAPKDAAAQGAEMGVKLLKETGLANKTLADANKKIDALELKKANPVSYYNSNPKAYLEDVKNKTVAPMSPKDLLMIQRKAKADAQARQSLKQHESTK
jgi:hypothetical protein